MAAAVAILIVLLSHQVWLAKLLPRNGALAGLPVIEAEEAWLVTGLPLLLWATRRLYVSLRSGERRVSGFRVGLVVLTGLLHPVLVWGIVSLYS